ncbi:MAG TPA: hypothetical protein VK605_04975 [Solirubrobacteraceae bacterium]|nr:hypothetical protein [Solirubrobacteraceae bacterium]
MGLGVFLYTEVHPGSVPTANKPSWLDQIVSNDVVLAAIRLGLIAGLLYLVVSLGGLISEGRWLSEIGPAKASKAAEPIARLDGTLKLLENSHQEALDTIKGLKQRLFESDEALGHAAAALTRGQDEIEALLDRVDKLEGEKGAS